MIRVNKVLVWAALASAISVPIALSAASPLLAWREPVYILAGFAGIIAMALLLVQPLLVTGYLPGLSGPRGKRMHRWIGAGLVITVVTHVAALWITSPPDVIDALLFASPTSFSVWGVTAMWAVFAASVLGAFRHRLRLERHWWRRTHTSVAMVVVVGGVVHAMMIEGTMEVMSKTALCVLVLAATAKAIVQLRVWSRRISKR